MCFGVALRARAPKSLSAFAKKLITPRCGAEQNHPFRTNPTRRIVVGSFSVANSGLTSREITKSRNFNTCANRARNSRRISTSIFKDLNMPRINTYRKSGAPLGRAKVYLQDELLRVNKDPGLPPRTSSSPRTSTNRMSFAALKEVVREPRDDNEVAGGLRDST